MTVRAGAPRHAPRASEHKADTRTTERGEPYDFSQLQGKVVVIVNTASKCGFTPQFKSLEQLYKEVKATPQGADFEILGFPCNQFGRQDPGTRPLSSRSPRPLLTRPRTGSNDDIQSFCQLNYGVSFPVLGKSDVNGEHANPVFEWLKSEKPGIMGLRRVKWNFEKFVVGRDGAVKGRWTSVASPLKLKATVLQELGASEGAVQEAVKEGEAAKDSEE